MTLTLRGLRQLVVLAEEANFTRAAEVLGMTQPSLSRSIAEIERTFGLRLFERGRLAVVPTTAGADLVANARRILGQVDAVELHLSLQSRGAAGRVAVGMGPLTASFLMVRLLSECLTERPSLEMSMVADETSILIKKVLEGSLDFCLCADDGVQPHPALSIRRAGVFGMGYFVRASHPLAQRDGVLAWEDLIAFPRAAGTAHSSTLGVFGALGATVKCDDFEFLRQIMLASDTVWLTSGSVLEAELASGAVREITVGSREVADARIILVKLAGRSQSPAMLHVVEKAMALMGPQQR